MKAIICIILTIISIQSTFAQKVDWNKPLYVVDIGDYSYKVSRYNNPDSLPQNVIWENDRYYKIYDTIAKFFYVGDTIIFRELKTVCKNTKTYVKDELVNEHTVSAYFPKIEDSITTYKYQGDTMIVKEFIIGIINEYYFIGGKIKDVLVDFEYGSYKQYTYDSLGSVSSEITFWYRANKLENADTILYTNKYDAKNRLIGIIGTDQTDLKIKNRKHKKIEISHKPKFRYRKYYYFKDLNYQNDTLIIEHTWRGNEYRRTEYDRVNRCTLIEEWRDYGDWIRSRGMYYTRYQYVDNLQIYRKINFDAIYERGIIYKKEE